MHPRHAVLLTLSANRNCLPWSYPYTGTLPRLISFVSHSYENTRGVGVFFPFWNSLFSLHFWRRLSPFRINTSESGDSKQLYPPLDSTVLKNRGRGSQLLLTRHATKHVCPERPSGVKDLSYNGSMIADSDPLANARLSNCQLIFGGKKIFQKCGAAARNSTGTSEPS